jgi:hypothetical protein
MVPFRRLVRRSVTHRRLRLSSLTRSRTAARFAGARELQRARPIKALVSPPGRGHAIKCRRARWLWFDELGLNGHFDGIQIPRAERRNYGRDCGLTRAYGFRHPELKES